MGCLCSSTYKAVAAVRILKEVFGVTARIPPPVLRKEHAIRVIGPIRTSAPHVIGSEALRKISASQRAADVLDELAHVTKCGISDSVTKTSLRRRPLRPQRQKRACLGSGLLGVRFLWQGPGHGANGAFQSGRSSSTVACKIA
jgi:hypothetical protein